jgi:Asp-tRNA(Asn)/Glu-tRNA(Gln) amidotransferase A subunit family amidase
VSPPGIVFGVEHPEGVARIPGYTALAPLVKTVRDPSLSLIALSGIEPTGPVMVEVPVVVNNTTFTATRILAGWRIGFAGRYVRGGHAELVEHSSGLRRAFDILRQAGAQLVAVDAQRPDASLEFTLQAVNEIDDLVTRHRLDALVSDTLNDAFHEAGLGGYPCFCEPMEDGLQLRFYGARWSRDSVTALVQAYRQQISAG